MGLSDINIKVLVKTIEKMPDEFFTKNVSSHPDMIKAHPELFNHSHYHSFVGKAIKKLSNQHSKWEIIEIRKKTSKGSLWRKKSFQLSGTNEIKIKSYNKLTRYLKQKVINSG